MDTSDGDDGDRDETDEAQERSAERRSPGAERTPATLKDVGNSWEEQKRSDMAAALRMLTQTDAQQVLMILDQDSSRADTQEHPHFMDEMWQILSRYDAIEEDPTTRLPRLRDREGRGSYSGGTDDSSPESDSGGTNTAQADDSMIVMAVHHGDPRRKKQKPKRHPKAQESDPRRGTKSTRVARGAQTLEQQTPVLTGALGVDIGGRLRKPKPRGKGTVDEFVWAAAMTSAKEQLVADFIITSTLEEYYATMCKVGQQLLADELHRRCQGLYDYRAGKLVYRENRRVNKRADSDLGSLNECFNEYGTGSLKTA